MTFARPKSRILAWPRLVTKMVAGLISRWTIPELCAASSASVISMASKRISSSFHRATADAVLQRRTVEKLHHDERLLPALSDFIEMVQMLGWFHAPETAQASRRKRSSGACGSWATSSGRNFGAAKRQVHVLLGLVNHTHPASAQFFEDAVVRNGLADHERKDSGNGRDGCGAKSMSRIGALRVDGSIAVPESRANRKLIGK